MEPLSDEQRIVELRWKLMNLSRNPNLINDNEVLELCIQIDQLVVEMNRKRRNEQ